jgi:cation transport ATPase
MNNYNDKEQEFLKKEQEIKAKEAEIRLRELELEITQSDRDNEENTHYQTRKHEISSSSLQRLSKKIIKVGKFLGFTIVTIALMRVGFFVGMWLAYGLITLVIILIGYQIFIKDSD